MTLCRVCKSRCNVNCFKAKYIFVLSTLHPAQTRYRFVQLLMFSLLLLLFNRFLFLLDFALLECKLPHYMQEFIIIDLHMQITDNFS